MYIGGVAGQEKYILSDSVYPIGVYNLKCNSGHSNLSECLFDTSTTSSCEYIYNIFCQRS